MFSLNTLVRDYAALPQLSGLSVSRDNRHFVVIKWSVGKALSWLVTGFVVLYFAGYVSGVLEQLEVGDVGPGGSL